MACKHSYIDKLSPTPAVREQLNNIHNGIFKDIVDSKLFRKYEGRHYLPAVGGENYLSAKTLIQKINDNHGFPIIGTSFTKESAKEFVFVNVKNYLPRVTQEIEMGNEAANLQEFERARGDYSPAQRGEFYQSDNIPATVASEKTLKLMKEFSKRIGVDVEQLSREEAKSGAKQLGGSKNSIIHGIADFLGKTIWLTEGKEAEAYTEENMHFAVAIIKQTNPALYKQMFNKIGSYKVYDVIRKDPGYLQAYRTEDNKLDIPKLKEEAIVKLLTEYVFQINEGSSFVDDFSRPSESAENMSFAQQWWEKIMDFFKGIFQKAGFNPFETIAKEVVSGEFEGTAADIADQDMMFQLGDNPARDTIYNKLKDINSKVAPTENGGYKINDDDVKYVINYVRDRPERPIDKRFGDKGKADIKNILKQLIDIDGFLRNAPAALEGYAPQLNTADMNAYEYMSDNISARLSDKDIYPEGTRFLYDINIYDDVNNRAGNVPFIAIKPNGQVDIMTWEFINGTVNKRGDIAHYDREMIQSYIGSLKRVLRSAYDVRDFGRTRAIPIQLSYTAINNGIVFKSIKMGDAKVNLSQKDYLQPLPTSDEVTGDEKIDKFIGKLNSLYKNLKNSKTTEGRKDLKAQQLQTLFKAIRHLQINQNFKPLFEQVDILIENTNIVIARHLEAFNKDNLKNFDNQAINEEAERLINSIEALDIYKALDVEFDEFFEETDEDNRKQIARLGSKARTTASQLKTIYGNFASNYISGIRDIKDLQRPEKTVPMIDRYMRTLSQLPTAATQTLWKMVDEAHNKTEWEVRDVLYELTDLKDDIKKWTSNKNLKVRNYTDLIKKKDKKGRVTNNLIDKYSPQFYLQLAAAIEKKNAKWVKDNIDNEAFIAWANDYRKKRFKQIEDTYYGGTPEEQTARKEHEKSIVAARTDYSKDYAWLNISTVKRFPTDVWFSKEYQEISKVGNEPIFKLYEFITKWNRRALKSEYLATNNFRTFLPFIRKGLVEKYAFGGSYNFIENIIANLTLDDQSVGYGNFNNLTGEIEDTVPKYFTTDIGKEKVDKDGDTYRDYSNVSDDIFKNLAVYIQQVVNYENKKEIESQARLLYFVEKNKQSLVVLPNGNILKDALGNSEHSESNEQNSKMFQAFMKNTIFGQKYTSTESTDVLLGKVGSGYNKVATAINKTGVNLPLISEEIGDRQISGTKLIDAANRMFSLKILGLNVASSVSQLVGGNFQAFVNSGKYYSSKEFFKAELNFSGHKLYKNKASVHLALMETFMPLAEGELADRMNKLSLRKVTGADLSNIIMFMMRGADHVVQYANFLAMIDNGVVIDGKLQNVREYYKNSPEYAARYQKSPAERAEMEKNFENKVDEIRKEHGLENFVDVVDGKAIFKGIDQSSIFAYRSLIQQIGKRAAGNITPNDENLIRLNVLGRSFMVFKNWIPGLIYTRVQGLNYISGTDSYEWGRMRMAAKILFDEGFLQVGKLRNMLKANDKGIAALDRLFEKKKKDYFDKTNKELDMTKEEFYDLVRQNIKSQWRDTLLSLGLIASLLAMKVLMPDDDDDESTKAHYRFYLRLMDKVTGEMTFFYNPMDMQSVLNGSVFPSLGVLTDVTKLLTSSASELFGLVAGDKELVESTKPLKYAMKTFPITKEALTYIALFTPDLAKEMGVQINPNARR